ncbi:MAG: MmgE/PrpD family protein [Cyanobacteria bacterium P01_A01_bin.84]
MNGKEFLDWTSELTRKAQSGVSEEITEHKKKGIDIFYIQDDVHIMEKPDGTKYEYKMVDDEPVIVREIKP